MAIVNTENLVSDSKTQIKILNLNIQSIRKKVNELNVILEEVKPSFICINEHWLKENEVDYYKLDNFSLVSTYCRATHDCGGTAIFTSNQFCKQTKEIQLNKVSPVEIHCEFCCAEFTINEFCFILVSIYRSPNGDFGIFFETMTDLLNELFDKKKRMFICGDFNINFARANKNANDIRNLFAAYNLISNLSEITRMGVNSSTQIDNIFFSQNINEGRVSVMKTVISDHYSQILSMSLNLQKTEKIVYYKRKYAEKQLANFKNMIKNEDWSEVYQQAEVNGQYDSFYKILYYYFDVCFPLTKSAARKQSDKKWVNNEIKIWAQKLRDLHSLYKDTGCLNVLNKYKQEKKAYRKYINEYKISCNDNIIENSKNKSKSVWNMFNKIQNKNRNTDTEIQLINNNKKTADPKIIADLFSSKFQMFPTNKSNTNRPKIKQHSSNFFLKPTDPVEVYRIIKNLPPKFSSGLDEIPSIVLKEVGEIISFPLANIINECLTQGIFPDQLKIAKVVPVYKKGEKTQIDNYRPVSLLSVISKIFERIIYIRILEYFIQNKIFVTSQHGFLPGRSTTTAIFNSINYIMEQIDKRQYVSGIYFDLSKAFDLINHDMLLQKLRCYGINGTGYNLIKSYLSNRSQKVCITSIIENKKETTLSDEKSVSMGVPQGSILGPILFLIFVNDLGCQINLDSLYQFADDTSCIVSRPDMMGLSQTSSKVVHDMVLWCENNELKLNVNKTGLMLFKNNLEGSIYVSLKGKSIEQINSIKFLGITLDKELRWTEHINQLVKTMNSACCVIRYIKDQLGINSIKLFYHAYVQSRISYSIMFWYHSVEANRVFLTQKRIVRTIFGLSRYISCKPYFKSLGLMTVPSLYILTIAVFTKKNLNVFPKNYDFYQNMRTRGGSNLSIPCHRTTFFEKGCYYNCIKIYNSLPNNIKDIESINKFKIVLKKYLIDQAFYSIDDYVK